jgi:hypothetical protein
MTLKEVCVIMIALGLHLTQGSLFNLAWVISIQIIALPENLVCIRILGSIRETVAVVVRILGCASILVSGLIVENTHFLLI